MAATPRTVHSGVEQDPGLARRHGIPPSGTAARPVLREASHQPEDGEDESGEDALIGDEKVRRWVGRLARQDLAVAAGTAPSACPTAAMTPADRPSQPGETDDVRRRPGASATATPARMAAPAASWPGPSRVSSQIHSVKAQPRARRGTVPSGW